MAKKSNNLNLIGKWAFIIGLALAVIAGLLQGIYTLPSLTLVLVVLGLLVGFLNVTENNTIKLLLSILILISIGSAIILTIPVINIYLEAILGNIVVLAGAAGLVVALKTALEVMKK